MEGRETLYVPGMDHAGIATQNVVEKKLARRGPDAARRSAARASSSEVWRWKEQYGGLILEAAAPDRDLARLVARALHRSTRPTRARCWSCFQKLHEKGLIYRGRYIVNWCPRCQTALSDEEVDHVEIEGPLWYISYPIKGTEKFITVATTRPETMLGDTAVAVHPKDRRYAHLDRQDRGAAADAPRDPDRRRRDGRSQVRDRRGQDHARARSQRLPDRASATTCRTWWSWTSAA